MAADLLGLCLCLLLLLGELLLVVLKLLLGLGLELLGLALQTGFLGVRGYGLRLEVAGDRVY